MTPDHPQSEAERLEGLWSGEFGDEYVDRNRAAYDHRRDFWSGVVADTGCRSVLEIGCNVGGNLRWLTGPLGPGHVTGVDVNRKALGVLHTEQPDVDASWAVARDLPFRDRRFDLVFTMGVLIHQPTETLPLVLAEMVRCSARWVLLGEYFADAEEEVHYRGHEGALFRRDYGRVFSELFPEWRRHSKGFLGRDQGWDDITWWLFERS